MRRQTSLAVALALAAAVMLAAAPPAPTDGPRTLALWLGDADLGDFEDLGAGEPAPEAAFQIWETAAAAAPADPRCDEHRRLCTLDDEDTPCAGFLAALGLAYRPATRARVELSASRPFAGGLSRLSTHAASAGERLCLVGETSGSFAGLSPAGRGWLLRAPDDAVLIVWLWTSTLGAEERGVLAREYGYPATAPPPAGAFYSWSTDTAEEVLLLVDR